MRVERGRRPVGGGQRRKKEDAEDLCKPKHIGWTRLETREDLLVSFIPHRCNFGYHEDNDVGRQWALNNFLIKHATLFSPFPFKVGTTTPPLHWML
jgi:hypothetical protein